MLNVCRIDIERLIQLDRVYLPEHEKSTPNMAYSFRYRIIPARQSIYIMTRVVVYEHV